MFNALVVNKDEDGKTSAAVAEIDAFHEAALDPVTGELLLPLIGVLDNPFALVA